MQKSNIRLGQQPISRWRKWLTRVPYKAIATEYQGQMTPLQLDKFSIWVVDTPYKKKLRQKIKVSSPKSKSWQSSNESGAETGPVWYIMSKFARTRPYYNYRVLSKEGIMQICTENTSGYSAVLEAFAHHPQDFSIQGFEHQYAPDELAYLQVISMRYQQLGVREKSNNITKFPSMESADTLTANLAHAVYIRIFRHRHEPTFPALWHNVITAAAAYINYHSTSIMFGENHESDVNVSTSLNTFILTLKTLARSTHQKREDKDWFFMDWLFILGKPTPDRQECANLAGYLLLFDTLQSNSTKDDDEIE